MKLIFAILLFPLFANSYEVAFLEVRDARGNLVQLEKGGRFAHIAIAFRDQWLHSVPYWGVELVSREKLEHTGKIAVVMRTSDRSQLSEAMVRQFVGKQYDNAYSWTDEKLYCSEMIAKILAIPPVKMNFDAPSWPEEYRRLNGLPGISPDAIYRVLKQRGYQEYKSFGM